MQHSHRIRVALADDHNLVRQGIRALLETAGDIEVVGEAADGQEAIDLVANLAPDVLLLDIAMPKMDGLQVAEQAQSVSAGTRIVVLSMFSDKALVRQALHGGASGYLLKGSLTEELLLAVRAAHRGQLYLSPAISRTVVRDYLDSKGDGGPENPREQLTAREREVLQLIVEGETNAAIAQQLDLSVKTVEKHRANLMSKLGVHDVAGLIRVAIQLRLVFLDG